MHGPWRRQARPTSFRLKDYRELLSKDLGWEELQDLLHDPEFFASYTVDEGIQSALIDRALGIASHEIEDSLLGEARPLSGEQKVDALGRNLHEGRQTWVGLDPETLQTPYPQLWEICEQLEIQKGEVVVDLGAAFGRLGLVLNCYAPETVFLGYEYVRKRAEEAERVFRYYHCENARVRCVDLADENFYPDAADVYFLYDYGRSDQVRTTLKQLKELSDQGKNFSVVARGRSVTSLIEYRHPWLAEVFEKRRFEEVTIFSNYPRFERRS